MTDQPTKKQFDELTARAALAEDRLRRVRGRADLARAVPHNWLELYRHLERISEIAGEGEE